MQESSWRYGVTRYQWLVLFVAWLGWVFDSMDSTIYTLVLHPALHELLAGQGGDGVSQEAVGRYGGIILSIFLLGWALGGVAFGVLADRFGRTKTLVCTILIYAVFTGMAAFSHTWRELGLVPLPHGTGDRRRMGGRGGAGGGGLAGKQAGPSRGPAAIGVGGRLLDGGVGQPADERSRLAHDLCRGCSAGCGGPAGPALGQGARALGQDPRARAAGGRGAAAAAGRVVPRPTTARLAFVAVFGLWGATNWTPTLVRSLPGLQGLDARTLTDRVSYATMMLNVGALLGYLSFGPLADRFGRRAAFALMCLGSLVLLPLTFLTPRSYAQVLLLLPLLGFFNNGIFSGFPLYLPELYPTRIRGTGSGFCFNAGRVLASAGPVITGVLVTALGTFGRAASAIALIYVLGLLILPFARETRGQPLPD